MPADRYVYIHKQLPPGWYGGKYAPFGGEEFQRVRLGGVTPKPIVQKPRFGGRDPGQEARRLQEADRQRRERARREEQARHQKLAAEAKKREDERKVRQKAEADRRKRVEEAMARHRDALKQVEAARVAHQKQMNATRAVADQRRAAEAKRRLDVAQRVLKTTAGRVREESTKHAAAARQLTRTLPYEFPAATIPAPPQRENLFTRIGHWLLGEAHAEPAPKADAKRFFPITDAAERQSLERSYRKEVDAVFAAATAERMKLLPADVSLTIRKAIGILRGSLDPKKGAIGVEYYRVVKVQANASFDALAAKGRGEIRWHPNPALVSEGNRALHEAIHGVLHQKYPKASTSFELANRGRRAATADDLMFQAFSEYQTYRMVAEFERATGVLSDRSRTPDEIARAQSTVAKPIAQLAHHGISFDPARWKPKG